MTEINAPTVMARLRTHLQHSGVATPPVAVQQLCIKSNSSAYVVWYLGRARYACSWFDGDYGAAVTGSYLDMLDYFCAQAGLPPLDSRQMLARVEAGHPSAEDRELARRVAIALRPGGSS